MSSANPAGYQSRQVNRFVIVVVVAVVTVVEPVMGIVVVVFYQRRFVRGAEIVVATVQSRFARER